LRTALVATINKSNRAFYTVSQLDAQTINDEVETSVEVTIIQEMSSDLIRRFKKVPLTLYRLQGRLPVRLREHASQMTAGRQAFDLKLGSDGLVHPTIGDTFICPNSMSLRPPSRTMLGIAQTYKGKVTVYTLAEGTTLPDGLILLHERDDHYSLQTDEPIALDTFNERLTELLEQCPSQTLPNFIEAFKKPKDRGS
jgi:hypothetical protein